MAKDNKSKAQIAIKGTILHISIMVGTLFLKLLPLILVIVTVLNLLFNRQKEIIQGKNTADEIYKILEVTDLNELVEIKGNDTEGYYWGFVDGVDDKLQKAVEKLEDHHGTVTIESKNLLKKMILAQVVTQYPDLGGKAFTTSKRVYSGTSEQKAEQMVKDLSIEEKVSQMLFVLTSNNSELSQNAGGYVLENGFDFSNTKASIENAKNTIPAIFAVDEEGGTVQRALSGYPSANEYIDTETYLKLQEEGNSQEADTLLANGILKLQNDSSSKAKSLLELGIQMNLAPVADVSDKNSYMGKRSFSPDYKIASSCVETAVKYMKQEGLITCLKHFPGYANAKDTHNGSYLDKRSIDEVQQDMAVFKKGIDTGAATVMTSHIIVESIDSENPASLSSKVVDQIRNLGFDGVIITDALNMHAVNGEKDIYVRAVNAGNDILEVTNFKEAKQQILDAVNNGKIKESKVNEAVKRILALKFEYSIINELNINTSFKGGIIDVPKIYMKDWNVPFPNYPSQNVSTTGCGFVSAAMIVSYFTGTDVTPKDIVDWGYKHYNGKGANGELFIEIAEHWNFGTVTQTKDYDKVVESLKSGYPVVSLQHKGKFTQGGHYIVLTGIDEEGRAHVNDPASEERTETSWDLYEDIHSTNDLYFIYDSGNLNKYDVTIDSEEVDGFQGAIHLRRVTPDKEIGKLEDVSTGVSIKKGTYVAAQSEGLGTKEDISESLKQKMEGVSMNGISGTSYDDLAYLTIPYYNFEDKVKKGHMVVNKELADEVLLIFQELYNIRYPIESMELVDEFKNKMKDVDFGEDENADAGTKLDITSMWHNNTSAFNDRKTSSGSISNHALGCAIDVNPLINPYVDSTHYSPLNAEKYTKRNMSGWTDVEKKAIINKDSEIYKIFTKYGWSWGGDWDSSKDYQHFEKTDLENVTYITNITVQKEEDTENSENTENNTNGQIAGDGKQYVVAIDAGHGPKEGADQGLYMTGTSDSSGLNTGMIERDYTKMVADAVADKLSIYSNLKIVRIGNSDEHPIVKNSDRVNMAKEAGADLYITIHYNGNDNKSVSGTEVYYPAESGYPEDTVSKQLAEILSNTVSSSIGIKNRGVFTEDAVGGLVIIKHSSLVGFPCVCIEGGFMSNQNDVKLLYGEEGVERYANGVAAGILEYCGLENKGYGQVGTSTGNVENNAGIRSKIFDLKYVTKDIFEEHVESGNQQALKEFSIDEEDGNKIMVATWSYSSGEGIKITTKKFQASNTYTQKYTMPIEYLIAFYIDTRNKEFIYDLADLAINSEFVLAVQDNVTTTETNVYNSVNRKKYKNNRKNLISNTTTKPSLTDSNINESVSTSVELTYGDTWFVKFYKDINYSKADLNVLNKTDRVNTVVDIDGNVSSTDSAYEDRSSPQTSTITQGDDRFIYVTTEITKTYIKSISYKYNTGEMHVLGNEQKFITIYKKNKDFRTSLKPEWLFKVLEQQNETQNMVDLTKYLIYLASGQKKDHNYGVTEFDFNEYAPGGFNNVTGIYGNTVEEKVWFGLRAAGYSEEATAGVMGNVYQESTFIPYNANASKGLEWSKNYMESVDNGTISREEFIHDGQGCGLFGWTWYKLKESYYDFAKHRNASIIDVDIQIELLLGSINPEGGADGYALYVMGDGMYGYTASDWKNATNPEDAAIAFCWTFEKPGKSEANESVRASKAREYYEKFKGMTAPTGGGDPRIGPISLSGENATKMLEMLTEAVRIADDDRYYYTQSLDPQTGRMSEFGYDCSSLVYRLYKKYFNIEVPSNTRGYGSAYYKGAPGQIQLEPGDVLWRSGHVEIYLGNNMRVGAHSANVARPDQISVKDYTPPGTFTKVYRFIE